MHIHNLCKLDDFWRKTWNFGHYFDEMSKFCMVTYIFQCIFWKSKAAWSLCGNFIHFLIFFYDKYRKMTKKGVSPYITSYRMSNSCQLLQDCLARKKSWWHSVFGLVLIKLCDSESKNSGYLETLILWLFTSGHP